MEDDPRIIVMDTGSYLTKAGFAGDEEPEYVEQTLLGKIYVFNQQLCGSSAHDAPRKYWPVKKGRITPDLASDMQTIWFYICHRELRVAPEDHRVHLTGLESSSDADREKIAELMFEGLSVPACYLSRASTMSLIASGRTTGLVIEGGDAIHTVPIHEGQALRQHVNRFEYGGSDLTERVRTALSQLGYDVPYSNSINIPQDVKETTCCVSPFAIESQAQSADVWKQSNDQTIQSFSLKLHSIPGTGFNHLPLDVTRMISRYVIKPDAWYTSWDGGNGMNIPSSMRYLIPEVLFQPKLAGINCKGIAESAFDVIQKCDRDLAKDLFGNIILGGETMQFPGMAIRLRNEIASLAPQNMRVKVIGPEKYSAWSGASLFAELPQFEKMVVTKKEAEEFGYSIVNKKWE